ERLAQRAYHRIRQFRHSRPGEIVSFFGNLAVGDAAVFLLNADREVSVGAVAVHAFDVRSHEPAREIRRLVYDYAPGRHAAERVVDAEFGEVDEEGAAAQLRLDGLRRRHHERVARSIEQRRSAAIAAACQLNGARADAQRAETLDDEADE